MSNNEQTNVEIAAGPENALLQINQLSYLMVPQLGICSARTHTIGFPQQSVYTNGETMTWDSQTGAFYIDPVGCYLKFSVSYTVNGTDEENKNLKCFGSGSACNLFSRIVVRTRSGKEVTRVENLNLLAKYKQLYSKPLDWVRTSGRAQGFSDPLNVGTDFADAVPKNGRMFIIPLCDIIPSFNVIGQAFLPPQLMEGLRIEISLADPNVAFCNFDQLTGDGSVTEYKIIRPEIHWDCYTLSDQFSRRLSEISATRGLILVHKEYFHSSVSMEGSDVNFDIKKAASKALTAHVICRQNTTIASPLEDSFASNVYDWNSIQSQIGSLYNPNQPLTLSNVTINGNMEAYYFALYGTNTYTSRNNSCITPENFTGNPITAGTPSAKTDYNNCMITFNLNKSNTSDIVGTVVNNSRALLINMRREAPIAGSRIDAYLCHVRAVQVFTSNAVISD
jgi:hypothetical protein